MLNVDLVPVRRKNGELHLTPISGKSLSQHVDLAEQVMAKAIRQSLAVRFTTLIMDPVIMAALFIILQILHLQIIRLQMVPAVQFIMFTLQIYMEMAEQQNSPEILQQVAVVRFTTIGLSTL